MRWTTTWLTLLLALPAWAQTAPDQASQRLPVCLACHGQSGTSTTPNVPSLGAMPVNYVLTQLYLFRENLRTAAPMNAMAAGLTDDDLRSLADTFNKAAAPAPAAELAAGEREAGQALVEKYHCNSCHGTNLEGQQSIPRIAGQRADYLEHSLVGYKTNARKGYSPTMNEVTQEVQEADIPVLARYIASYRPAQ